MEDHGLFAPPHPDYFADHPDHLWPARKLGFGLDDIFTTLPKQFNLMAMPILDREAFRIEALHMAHIARDREHFLELLQSQLLARKKELLDIFMDALQMIAGDPRQMINTKHWGDAMHIYRYKSLDTFTRFFAGFLREPEVKPWAWASESSDPKSDPKVPTAIWAASRDDSDCLTPEIESKSPRPSSVNASSDVPIEGPSHSRARSSVSTTTESQASSTDSAAESDAHAPRTRKRKRSVTPANGSLADDDEDENEMPPSKKTRISPSTSPQTSVSPRARPRRARKGQPSVPNPTRSTTSTTAQSTASTTSSGLRPGTDESKAIDPSERRDSGSIPRQTTLGNSGQHMRSPLEPLGTNHKRDDVEASHNMEPITDAPRLRLRKGQIERQSPSPSPRIRPSGKIGKPTTPTRQPVRKPRRATSQKARGGGTMDRARSSQRLTRRNCQGNQDFRELDSHGKARLVGSSTR